MFVEEKQDYAEIYLNIDALEEKLELNKIDREYREAIIELR